MLGIFATIPLSSFGSGKHDFESRLKDMYLIGIYVSEREIPQGKQRRQRGVRIALKSTFFVLGRMR